MALTNLEQSGFRKLDLIKSASDSTDDDDGGGYQGLEDFLLQKLDRSSLPELSKLDASQLLAPPWVASLIDEFINKELDSVSSEKKNATKSVEYRTLGKEQYLLGRFSHAVYYYTMAIIYAPDVPENVGNDNVDDNVDDDNVPEELSLAYGNRSAAFYELGQYEASLADIDHSLATGYPREKQPELLLRKVECLISLKQLVEAKRVWEQLCIIEEPKDDDERALKIRLQLLDINSDVEYFPQKQPQSTDPLISVLNYLTRTERFQPSTKFSSLSAKVEPRYSPTSKGRHLVAKQDIEQGDILLVESPFASVLKRDFEYHFCHHCCRKLESKIGEREDELWFITGSVVPCTECTRVLYCSTDCRTVAWRTYHQYECSILPILHKMDDGSHLSLRLLLSTGLDVIQQVCDQSQDVNDEFKDPLSSLKMRDPKDAAAYYRLMHGLIDPQDSISREVLLEYVIASTVLVQLAKKCTFVLTDEQAKSATTILYRQLRQLRFTMLGIDCWVGIVHTQNQPDPPHFAVCIYPYDASVMNHSCEPNSVFSFVQSTVMVHRASKKIAAGLEVTANYESYGFTEQELPSRQELLLNKFHFWCECSRCVLEERDGLDGKYFPIGCKDCGSTLMRETSASVTFHCSNTSCAAGTMFLFKAEQLYSQIEILLTIVTDLIETFENGGPVVDQFVLECQRLLSEVSSLLGRRNCWQVGELHRRLSDAVRIKPNLLSVTRQHFESYCEISEAYSGLTRALTNHRKLIRLYIADAFDAGKSKDDGQVDYLLKQKCRIVVNRTIELVRLNLLAEVEPPATDDDGLDLLVEESRPMRKLYQDLVKLLAVCVKKN